MRSRSVGCLLAVRVPESVGEGGGVRVQVRASLERFGDGVGEGYRTCDT